jgi:L-histidine N-alpha-methyltransferase
VDHNDKPYTVLERVVRAPGVEDLAIDALVGLSESPKRLPSRLFYDAVGSGLFRRITELDEYYLTRKELEILRDHGERILAPLLGRSCTVVDLGAGDGHKSAVLLERLLAGGGRITYAPLDVSEAAMRGLCSGMRARFPGLHLRGLVGEYFDGMRALSDAGATQGSKLVLLLGSNLGNFSHAQARGFLRRLWSALDDGDLLLVGFDLKKDVEILLAAYNDSEGVTSAFNLNLLHRLNRELGADFEVAAFRHHATYDPDAGAMQSYLLSRRRQDVTISALGATFSFEPWEAIHTECSYKYLESDIEAFARFTGFEVVARACDEQRWYCDALWRVRKVARAETPVANAAV